MSASNGRLSATAPFGTTLKTFLSVSSESPNLGACVSVSVAALSCDDLLQLIGVRAPMGNCRGPPFASITLFRFKGYDLSTRASIFARGTPGPQQCPILQKSNNKSTKRTRDCAATNNKKYAVPQRHRRAPGSERHVTQQREARTKHTVKRNVQKRRRRC